MTTQVDCSDGIVLTLREADSGDAVLLVELDVATWASGHPGHLPEDLVMNLATNPWHNVDFWQRRLDGVDRPHWIWIAEAPVPVGYIAFGASTEPDWPDYRGEIERFYLLEDRRGRGLGSLIWQRAVAQLAQADLLPHLTTVFTFNIGAQRFYERQGGKRLGEQTAFEWRGEPVREYVYGFGDDVRAN